jgi:hypothetical protein
MKIDLDKHRTQGVRNFIGRDRGLSVRQQLKLEDYTFDDKETINIEVPEDTTIVSSSFLLGLLGNTIRSLGEEEFRSRLKYTEPLNKDTVDRAIQRALGGQKIPL